jgi:tetratricopeptide (TPR) repeat protein
MSTMMIAATVAVLASATQSSAEQADSRLCDRAVSKVPGALDSVKAHLQQATVAQQTARMAFFRGCQHWGEGKDGPAAAEFEKASRADPASAMYHFWLGRVYGEQAQGANPLRQPGLARRTKSHFEKAVALDPDYVDGREGLMEYYLQAPGFLGGSREKAKEQAAEITKRNPYRGGLLTANIAIRGRDTSEALRIHESLISQFPDSIGPYVQALNILRNRRAWAQAWGTVDKLQATRPDYRVTNFIVGSIAAESGERMEAGEKALEEYLTYTPRPNEPRHAITHWRLGMIREKQSDKEGARHHYQASLAADPKFRNAQDALARVK